MKREALSHSKMARLARLLNIERYAAIGLMEALWNLTAREAPAGDLGKLTDDDIADGVWWRRNSQELITALSESGWIDLSDRQNFTRIWVHDWHDHCDDGVNHKLVNARRLFANGEIPKFSKVHKDERVALLSEFRKLQNSFRSIKNSQEVPRAGVSQALPSLALPSQAKPAAIETLPTTEQPFSTQPVETEENPPPLKTPSKPHPKAMKPTGEVLTGKKAKPRPAPDPATVQELEDRAWTINALCAYPGAAKLPGEPDLVITSQCLALAGNDRQRLADALVAMSRAGKKPETSWAYFPSVLPQFLPHKNGAGP